MMKTAIAAALYNGEKFIIEQLKTFQTQTRMVDMVVLCDDGSKDDTIKLTENYITEHTLQKNWKVYRNEKNLGYIQNFYKAITLCDAELIFLSDQDDIWDKEKVEIMSNIMETHPEVSLLCCQYGIINENGEKIHSIVEETGSNTQTLKKIEVKEIMRAYRWPGMAMCLRKDFFNKIYDQIVLCNAAHDLVLAITAADQDAFYTMDYIGVYHRRHDNNAAREEHRISKLLNRSRKLLDIAVTIQQWSGLLEASLPISNESKKIIEDRLEQARKREEAIRERSLKKIWKLYKSDREEMLRLKSFLCDIWLVFWGR